MRPEVIQEQLRVVPFRPFRIHLSDGSVHEVRHPELALVTRVRIYLAIGADEGRLPADTVTLAPMHITHLEPIRAES